MEFNQEAICVSLAKSSGFFSPSDFLFTLAPAPSGSKELVTLENDDDGEKAPIPTKMKANIRIRITILKPNAIAMS